MYHPYDRQKSRDRSRERERKFNNRSPSQQENAYQRKQKQKYSRGRGKRVKFEGQDDIRVFKKEDEPAAKGLTEDDLLKIKAEIQKEIAKSYDFNWEHYKHRDALLENHSIKEQKEKEKALTDKLMSAKELLIFYSPPILIECQGLIDRGCDSLERTIHSQRIHDILGCYYTHVSEIPNQPQFQILNTNSAVQSKPIKFDNNQVYDRGPSLSKQADNAKPIKGILKTTNNELVDRGKSQPRQVDPYLINMLKDFKINPQLYTKEKTQQLLKPYRDSGQLDYLMKNKEVLQAMLKSTTHYSNTQPKTYPIPINTAPIHNQSAQRSASQQQYQTQPQQPNNMGYTHTFVPKADKFRTVPCKYFQSPQGCSKVDNCTFIHDEKLIGTSMPNANYTPTASTQQQQVPPNPRMQPSSYPPSSYPPSNYGYSMPPVNSMPPNSNYYRQPMGYPPTNTNYYGNPAPQGAMNAYQPYPMNKGPPPTQYPQNGQYMNNPQQPQPQPYPPSATQSFSQVPSQYNGVQGYGSNPNHQYYIGNNGNK